MNSKKYFLNARRSGRALCGARTHSRYRLGGGCRVYPMTPFEHPLGPLSVLRFTGKVFSAKRMYIPPPWASKPLVGALQLEPFRQMRAALRCVAERRSPPGPASPLMRPGRERQCRGRLARDARRGTGASAGSWRELTARPPASFRAVDCLAARSARKTAL